jgi:hypothetical protein
MSHSNSTNNMSTLHDKIIKFTILQESLRMLQVPGSIFSMSFTVKIPQKRNPCRILGSHSGGCGSGSGI